MSRWLVVLGMVGGCHGVVAIDTTRPGKVTRVRRGAPIEGAPALRLSDGALRFVTPRRCAVDETVTLETTTELRTEPNFATVVVGIIVTSLGAVASAEGFLGKQPAGDPLSYLGPVAVAAGLPLAIGPFLGLGSELRRAPPGELHRAGADEPCGSTPLAATAATLTLRGLEVRGAIAADGTFAISPYQLVDAFDAAAVPAWDVTAVVDTRDGPRTITAVIEARALAADAAAFLRHADFDAKLPPLRLVPGLVAGMLRVSLTSTADGPALRVVLPLRNDGPGEAFAVRGQLTAGDPAVDGRVLYVGHLAVGEASARELIIPLATTAAARLRGGNLDLSLELHDGHGTAPTTPVRFRGAVLNDAPR